MVKVYFFGKYAQEMKEINKWGLLDTYIWDTILDYRYSYPNMPRYELEEDYVFDWFARHRKHLSDQITQYYYCVKSKLEYAKYLPYPGLETGDDESDYYAYIDLRNKEIREEAKLMKRKIEKRWFINTIEEELIERAMHPDRISRLINEYGEDIWDNI